MAYQETAYQKFIPIDADGNVISFGGGISGNVSVANFPATQAVTGIFYQSTQPVSATSLPLAPNAATDTTLQQVRDAIKAQIAIASTIWSDNSGAFYILRNLVNESTGAITNSFTDATGTAATPGTGLHPLASTDKDTITDFYDVLTSGAGYSIGDLLARVGVLDINSSTPAFTAIWLNLTLGTILGSAPTSANIERANENIGARQIGSWSVGVNNFPSTQAVSLTTLPLPSGAATSALQTTINTSITNGLMPAGTRTRYLGTSAGANLKTSAGTVYAITCSNNNAAVMYFQLFQKTTAPALNDVPIECFPVYQSNGLLLIGQDILGGAGMALATGIAWGFSTTRLIYTAGTAADCITTIRWS